MDHRLRHLSGSSDASEQHQLWRFLLRNADEFIPQCDRNYDVSGTAPWFLSAVNPVFLDQIGRGILPANGRFLPRFNSFLRGIEALREASFEDHERRDDYAVLFRFP